MAGVALSLIFAFVEMEAAWLVAVIAIAVATMNIQAEETMKLLLWTIGMGVFGAGALASSLAGIPAIGSALSAVIVNIGLFFTTIAGVFLLKIRYKIFSK